MSTPVIVGAVRTAIGSFNGSLAQIPAATLGGTCIKELLKQSKVSTNQINEVILGQVLQAGTGQNPARQALIQSGIPVSVPAMTINKVCGSGLKAVILGAQSILSQSFLNSPAAASNDLFIIAGGQENMSLSPRLYLNSREANRMGDIALKDSMVVDGLWCAFNDYHMGITAENIVEKHKITREAQDIFAYESQIKALKAISEGKFKKEIVGVEVKDKKGTITMFEEDEYVRKGVSLESLQKLRPAFKKDGTVTAGNSSGINDGAAAVLITTQATAIKHGLPILGVIRSFAYAGVDPKVMGLGVVPAVQKCLNSISWDINRDIELIEANEAFAAQSLGVIKELGIENVKERVNVNGGAIALGHPIGASGCRVLVTLLHELKRTGRKKGLATLCIGGGQGVALAIEAI